MTAYKYKTFVSTIAISLLTMVAATSCGGQATQSTSTPPRSQSYQLVWSDEFNGADGSVPDASKWAIQTGGNGWGNHELEYYTARPQNVQVSGGNLVITAIEGRLHRAGWGDTTLHVGTHADERAVLADLRAV